jgi:hypothetical protein
MKDLWSKVLLMKDRVVQAFINERSCGPGFY